MNVVNIDKEGYDLLNTWAKENKRYLLICAEFEKFYFQKCQLVFEDKFYAHCEVKQQYVKMTLHMLPKSPAFAKLLIRYTPECEKEYTIECIELQQLKGFAESGVAQCIVNAFVNINTFFYYANLTEGKTVVIRSRNVEGDKVFTLKKFENTLYCVQTSARRSPNGIFSVRGHFRRYKDGKVIWIDEYLKGLNEK